MLGLAVTGEVESFTGHDVVLFEIRVWTTSILTMSLIDYLVSQIAKYVYAVSKGAGPKTAKAGGVEKGAGIRTKQEMCSVSPRNGIIRLASSHKTIVCLGAVETNLYKPITVSTPPLASPPTTVVWFMPDHDQAPVHPSGLFCDSRSISIFSTESEHTCRNASIHNCQGSSIVFD